MPRGRVRGHREDDGHVGVLDREAASPLTAVTLMATTADNLRLGTSVRSKQRTYAPPATSDLASTRRGGSGDDVGAAVLNAQMAFFVRTPVDAQLRIVEESKVQCSSSTWTR